VRGSRFGGCSFLHFVQQGKAMQGRNKAAISAECGILKSRACWADTKSSWYKTGRQVGISIDLGLFSKLSVLANARQASLFRFPLSN